MAAAKAAIVRVMSVSPGPGGSLSGAPLLRLVQPFRVEVRDRGHTSAAAGGPAAQALFAEMTNSTAFASGIRQCCRAERRIYSGRLVCFKASTPKQIRSEFLHFT